VLEGSRGFLAVYSPHPEPERLTDALGDRYLMLGITLKSYPCHVTFQAMVDGIQGFRAKNYPFNPMDVQDVRVRTLGRVLEERFGNRAPTTMLGAQYSLPWSLALACCRDVAQPASWCEEDLSDPEVRRIAALIDLGEGPDTEITLTIAGKEHTLQVHDWKGSTTNPYTYEEVAEKFARYSEPVLDKNRIVEISERVAALEKEQDVAPLIALIGGTDGNR
jgi:2-methylcitrate dehydratase PrpD